jgi:hypothetical protein
VLKFVTDNPDVSSHCLSTQHYSANSMRQTELTEAIMNLVADSMLPLQLVETPGFKTFMLKVDPKYMVPSRRTISRRIVESLEEMKSELKTELETVMAAGCVVHSTMDLWSSRAMEPIAGIRFHYFDVNFVLHVKTACYRHFGERHTGENIAAIFEEVLETYGILILQAGYQVTDNAQNMIKAFQIFSLHAASASQNDDSDLTINADFQAGSGIDKCGT